MSVQQEQIGTDHFPDCYLEMAMDSRDRLDTEPYYQVLGFADAVHRVNNILVAAAELQVEQEVKCL